MISVRMPLGLFVAGKKFTRQTMSRLGTEVKQLAVKSLKGPSPSMPGTPPGYLTGALSKSIRVKVWGKKIGVNITAGAKGTGTHRSKDGKVWDAWYAVVMEKGAEHVGRPKKGAGVLNKNGKLSKRRGTSNGIIAPRPFLEPAANKVLATAGERVAKAIELDITFKSTK